MLHVKTVDRLDLKNDPTKATQPSGILKFINQQNSSKRPEGKKCNPYRQFGVSSDAPIQFCTKNTLIADMINFRQAKKQHHNKPEHYSQKNFFSISHNQAKHKPEENNFLQQYNKSHSSNSRAFHRNSNKITKFFDKNAWMGNRFHVMGHQRSETARQLSKVNSEVNYRSTKSLYLSRKAAMSPSTTFRTSTKNLSHQNMKQIFMGEKAKIRQMRNMLASDQFELTEQKRPYTSYQHSRSASRKFTVQSKIFKKPKQFQVNTLQWGEKDFNMKFLEWNPQRNKQSMTFNKK